MTIYMDTSVNILGTQYKILHKDYSDDKEFETAVGYCNMVLKEIVVGKLETFPDYKEESDEFCAAYYKETLRHEIVHAFLTESGLTDSTLRTTGGWATNEEMVDWIALQFPKIYKIYQELNIL